MLTGLFLLAPSCGYSRSVPDTSPQYQWTASDRVRKAREVAGLEKRELAAATGLNKNTISKLEPDEKDPSPDLSTIRETTWRVLAQALSVSVEWLRDGEDGNDEEA